MPNQPKPTPKKPTPKKTAPKKAATAGPKARNTTKGMTKDSQASLYRQAMQALYCHGLQAASPKAGIIHLIESRNGFRNIVDQISQATGLFFESSENPDKLISGVRELAKLQQDVTTILDGAGIEVLRGPAAAVAELVASRKAMRKEWDQVGRVLYNTSEDCGGFAAASMLERATELVNREAEGKRFRLAWESIGKAIMGMDENQPADFLHWQLKGQLDALKAKAAAAPPLAKEPPPVVFPMPGKPLPDGPAAIAHDQAVTADQCFNAWGQVPKDKQFLIRELMNRPEDGGKIKFVVFDKEPTTEQEMAIRAIVQGAAPTPAPAGEAGVTKEQTAAMKANLREAFKKGLISKETLEYNLDAVDGKIGALPVAATLEETAEPAPLAKFLALVDGLAAAMKPGQTVNMRDTINGVPVEVRMDYTAATDTAPAKARVAAATGDDIARLDGNAPVILPAGPPIWPGSVQMMTENIIQAMADKAPRAKPALGLKPRWIVDEHRLAEIMEAIDRFKADPTKQGQPLPLEWLVEMTDVSERIAKHQIRTRP